MSARTVQSAASMPSWHVDGLVQHTRATPLALHEAELTLEKLLHARKVVRSNSASLPNAFGTTQHVAAFSQPVDCFFARSVQRGRRQMLLQKPRQGKHYFKRMVSIIDS